MQGIKAHPSVSGVNEPIDLAIIATPAGAVPAVLEECMQCKVKAAIIISAGFSETGEKENTGKIAELI